MIIGIILGALLLGIVLLCAYVVKVTIYPKTKDHEFTYEKEIEKGFFTKEYYEKIEKEEIKIKSTYGYDINAIWFPCENSNITAIIAHGFSYTLYGSIKYVKMFHKLGINALVYDQRYHGLSGGKNTTFGYREKDDLKTIVDYMESRFSSDMIIGTHGESLGGATALMHGAMDKRVKFIISDCAFSDVKKEISYRMKVENNIPKFPFVYLVSFFTGIITGAYYSRVSPISVAEQIEAPTMIIHGKEDDYTPYEQGVEIYDKLKCSKYFYGAEGANHAQSIVVDEDTYTKEVEKFLKENNLI